MKIPQIGDRVFYTYAAFDLEEGREHLAGEVRPATIVRDFSSSHPSAVDPTVACYNLSVDTDFANDGKDKESGRYWATSRHFSAEPKLGAFHYAGSK